MSCFDEESETKRNKNKNNSGEQEKGFFFIVRLGADERAVKHVWSYRNIGNRSVFFSFFFVMNGDAMARIVAWDGVKAEKNVRKTNKKKILFSNYKIFVWQVLLEIDRGVSLLSVYISAFICSFCHIAGGGRRSRGIFGLVLAIKSSQGWFCLCMKNRWLI